MEIYTRPLTGWPRPFTDRRRSKPFHSTFEQTLRKLKSELRHLDAGSVMLQVAMGERDISPTTGYPRADRKGEHPGVILAADTRHGPLKWVCDACDRWQDNLHAIVLTLERLRLADLYGVTGKGEQYAGWKMLPGPITTEAPAMTIDAAARFVAEVAGVAAARVLGDRGGFEQANRAAHKRLHPDSADHDPARWKRLSEAAALLNNLHNRR